MLGRTLAYGLSFLFPEGDTAIGASLRDYGEFARPEVELIASYMDQFKDPGTFIDVGANIGAITLPLAAKRRDWKVIAIEAHRELSNVLAANTLNNRLYNVEVICAAVGAESGITTFPSVSLSSKINFGVLGTHLKDKIRSERVLMLNLDDFAPPNTRLVKVDVEGAEAQVLQGAGNLIEKIRPIWLLEANRADPYHGYTEESARETRRVLSNAGYSLFWFFAPFTTANSSKAPAQRSTELRGDMNFIALPEGIANIWDLPKISDYNAPSPSELAQFGYMMRYGFERSSFNIINVVERGAARIAAAGCGSPSLMYSTPPLVSVGLYVYNGERFLEEGLRSILNQTFTDFELIISDNASTDRTGEIAEAYAKRDHRIRYHRSEKNMGAGWNMRRVYELAMAKYFKWAAVDDLLEPDFLRRCVEVLESDPDCVVAYANTKEVDESRNYIRNYSSSRVRWRRRSSGAFVMPMKSDSSDPVERFRGLMMTGGDMCYQVFGVMRMSALRQLPPHGSYVNADGVLLARMSLLGRFHEIPEYLFISRRHSKQSMATLPVRLTQQRRFRLTNQCCTLPCPEWWDPAKTRALTFPEFRRLLEYCLSIYRAPLGAGQKLRCYAILLLWTKMYFRLMLRDLLIAADQMLYNVQSQQEGTRERKLS
jgi:FkbM family methyltransferase